MNSFLFSPFWKMPHQGIIWQEAFRINLLIHCAFKRVLGRGGGLRDLQCLLSDAILGFKWLDLVN